MFALPRPASEHGSEWLDTVGLVRIALDLETGAALSEGHPRCPNPPPLVQIRPGRRRSHQPIGGDGVAIGAAKVGWKRQLPSREERVQEGGAARVLASRLAGLPSSEFAARGRSRNTVSKWLHGEVDGLPEDRRGEQPGKLTVFHDALMLGASLLPLAATLANGGRRMHKGGDIGSLRDASRGSLSSSPSRSGSGVARKGFVPATVPEGTVTLPGENQTMPEPTLAPVLAHPPFVDIGASLVLVLILLLIRLAAGHAIRRRADAAPHQQRRWTANVRNLLLFLGLLGLVMIWAPQLRTFALSLTAVAVAVVIATKELILCFTGSLVRASTRSFAVGDWIEIAGLRGEVVDHNLFVTIVHEFEPGTFNYTGRTAVLPNSVFLGQPMRNDSLMREHTYLRFSLTVDKSIDVFAQRAEIEAIVARHHAPLRDGAARANERIERRFQVDLMDAQVRVALRTTELAKVRIDVTLFCPTRQAESLENAITCELMSHLHCLAERQRRDETAAQVRAGEGPEPGPSAGLR